MTSSRQSVQDRTVWVDSATHYVPLTDDLCHFEGTADGYIDPELDSHTAHWTCPTCGHEGEASI